MNFIDTGEGESVIKAFEDAASKNGELEVFSHECVKNMVDFKWNSYGYYNHYLGFFMHVQYLSLIHI